MGVFRRFAAAMFAVFVGVALAITSIAGQTPQVGSKSPVATPSGTNALAEKPWTIATRTPDGQPDIRGYWMTQAFKTSLEPG